MPRDQPQAQLLKHFQLLLGGPLVDFLYAPFDHTRKHSSGLVFLNISCAEAAERLLQHLTAHALEFGRGPCHVKVAYANVQGLERNLTQYLKTAAGGARLTHLPLVLLDGQQLPFSQATLRLAPEMLHALQVPALAALIAEEEGSAAMPRGIDLPPQAVQRAGASSSSALSQEAAYRRPPPSIQPATPSSSSRSMPTAYQQAALPANLVASVAEVMQNFGHQLRNSVAACGDVRAAFAADAQLVQQLVLLSQLLELPEAAVLDGFLRGQSSASRAWSGAIQGLPHTGCGMRHPHGAQDHSGHSSMSMHMPLAVTFEEQHLSYDEQFLALTALVRGDGDTFRF